MSPGVCHPELQVVATPTSRQRKNHPDKSRVLIPSLSPLSRLHTELEEELSLRDTHTNRRPQAPLPTGRRGQRFGFLPPPRASWYLHHIEAPSWFSDWDILEGLAWPPTGLVGPCASWRPWQIWEYQSHLLLGRPWFGEGRGLFVGGFTQGNIGDSSWGKGPWMQSLNLVLLLHLALSPSFDMGVGGGSLEAWHHSCFLMRPHLGWRCSSWHVPVTVRLLLAAALRVLLLPLGLSGWGSCFPRGYWGSPFLGGRLGGG